VRGSMSKVGGRHKHPEAVRELNLVDGFPHMVFTFEFGAEVGLSIARDRLAIAGRYSVEHALWFPRRQRAEHYLPFDDDRVDLWTSRSVSSGNEPAEAAAWGSEVGPYLIRRYVPGANSGSSLVERTSQPSARSFATSDGQVRALPTYPSSSSSAASGLTAIR
jgi:hypothetical protein